MHRASHALDIFITVASSTDLFSTSEHKRVKIITASDLLSALTQQQGENLSFSGLKLVLCENLELLDSAYELGVALLLCHTQKHPVRFIGLSNSLNDPADLAAWLNVDPLALHSFQPSDRDQSLTIHTQTFTIPPSAALFKAMAKPAHAAIRASNNISSIIFVTSRGQCRSVARDLITQCALESGTTRGYLSNDMSEMRLEQALDSLQDRELFEFVSRGVGILHEEITRPDRKTMLQLYAEGVLRVLIAPRDACWSLRVRAACVVVMGTQNVRVMPGEEERKVREYSLTELVRMQGRAVMHGTAGHFHLFCQAEIKDTYTRFLNDGLPLESQLLETDELRRWYVDKRKDKSIATKQHAVDFLSFTFLAQRLLSNPTYYDGTSTSRDELLSEVIDALDEEVKLR